MRVQFTRSGGVAGLQLAVTIESDTLPQEDAQELRRLIEQADFFNLAAEQRDTVGADQFSYEVTVETGGQVHTVKTTDSAAPATLLPLLDWLSRAARRRPGSN